MLGMEAVEFFGVALQLADKAADKAVLEVFEALGTPGASARWMKTEAKRHAHVLEADAKDSIRVRGGPLEPGSPEAKFISERNEGYARLA